ILEKIRNFFHLAGLQNAADDRSSLSRRGVLSEILAHGRAETDAGIASIAIDLAVANADRAAKRVAELDGRSRQRVEHFLQIERRAADDLQDFGGRGLQLQRFA